MNRRSFFAFLAALPFLPSAVKTALRRDLSQDTFTVKDQAFVDTLKSVSETISQSEETLRPDSSMNIQKDVAYQRQLQEAEETGGDPPVRHETLYTEEELLSHYVLWSKYMTGLNSCVNARDRLLGVTTGSQTWWFPLSLVKEDTMGFLHTWWRTLPELDAYRSLQV